MISLNPSQIVQSFQIDADFSGKIEFSFPIRDIQCYWMPELRLPSQKIHWRISCKSSGVCNFPFLSFFNTAGRNRVTIMLDTLDDDCEIFCRMNQKEGVYEVSIRIAPQESCTLTIDRRDKDWQEILGDYRASLALSAPRIPDGAWLPVFCTWYAVHTGVSAAWLEANGRIAAELGFGTLIVDDGWSFDRVKRHSPKLIDTWYEEIGDWRVSSRKLPEFAAHVAKIQALGLNYMLWIAPPIVGEKSELHAALHPGDLDPERIDGSHRLLPERQDALELMAEKFARLMADFRLDGLKIDYLDFFKPDCDAPKGRAMRAFARLISERIRAVKPDALIEYRQSYTVPGMLDFATQYRAGDVPYDWLDNFNRLAQMRTTLGDALPLHADPAFWRPDEPLENVGRHMIAALAGVPMLSMELTGLPEEQRQVIRTYLALYHEYRPVWQAGHWRVEYRLGNVASMTAELGRTRIAFVNDPCRIPESATLIFNLSNERLTLPGVCGYDARGTLGDGIPCGGFGIRVGDAAPDAR